MRRLREQVYGLYGLDCVSRGQGRQIAGQGGRIARHHKQPGRSRPQQGPYHARLQSGPGRVCAEQVRRAEAAEIFAHSTRVRAFEAAVRKSRRVATGQGHGGGHAFQAQHRIKPRRKGQSQTACSAVQVPVSSARSVRNAAGFGAQGHGRVIQKFRGPAVDLEKGVVSQGKAYRGRMSGQIQAFSEGRVAQGELGFFAVGHIGGGGACAVDEAGDAPGAVQQGAAQLGHEGRGGERRADELHHARARGSARFADNDEAQPARSLFLRSPGGQARGADQDAQCGQDAHGPGRLQQTGVHVHHLVRGSTTQTETGQAVRPRCEGEFHLVAVTPFTRSKSVGGGGQDWPRQRFRILDAADAGQGVREQTPLPAQLSAVRQALPGAASAVRRVEAGRRTLVLRRSDDVQHFGLGHAFFDGCQPRQDTLSRQAASYKNHRPVFGPGHGAPVVGQAVQRQFQAVARVPDHAVSPRPLDFERESGHEKKSVRPGWPG